MLQSHLAMAARQLIAHKTYAVINIVGLALGIACATLIALFVRHELSYDRHYTSSERIVRISDDVVSIDGEPGLHFAGTAPIVAPLLKDYFPEVERAARLSTCFSEGAVLSVGGQPFFEPYLAGADNELFEIFDFEHCQRGPSKGTRKTKQEQRKVALSLQRIGNVFQQREK